MQKTIKFGSAIIVFIFFIFFVHSHFFRSSGASTPTAQNGTLKIGALLALTGDAANYGVGSKNVIDLAVDEINAAGGIGGERLQIIYADGKCNPNDAVKAVQKLVNEDHVRLIIGGSCSSETLAAIPFINSHGVLLFSPTSSSPSLTNISPYFFRLQPSDDAQGKVLAEFSYIEKKWSKIAFLVEQLEFPKGVFNSFETTFHQLGGSIVKEEFPTTMTDYRPYLIKLKASNPQALFLDLNSTVSLERALKQLEELQWKPPLIVLDILASNPGIVRNHETLFEGAIVAAVQVDSKNPKFQHLAKAYREKYGQDLPFPNYSQNIYDAVYLIKDGILKVGFDSKKLADWSRKIQKWQGVSGEINIDQFGDRVGTHAIKIIKNGVIYDYADEH